MGRLALYWNTMKYMKPSQVYYRFRKMAGFNCTLGCAVKDFVQLHYFEYLFPLVGAYRKTGNKQYFEKAKECIRG